MTLGGCKRAASISIKYANERIQFKQPISSFGAIQHKLAQQAIEI
jgi:alkylation response protein AidB-like acyl-CoA dehydrogenase